jgi:hypothetical protein
LYPIASYGARTKKYYESSITTIKESLFICIIESDKQRNAVFPIAAKIDPAFNSSLFYVHVPEMAGTDFTDIA